MATSPLDLTTDEARSSSPGFAFGTVDDSSRPGPLFRMFSDAMRGIRDNAVIFAVLVPYAALALLVDAVSGVPVADKLVGVDLWHPLSRTVRLGVMLFALSVVWFAVSRVRDRRRAGSGEASQLPDLWSAWRRFPLRPTVRRVSRFVVCLIAYALFLHVFVGFKGAIPVFHPFAWDELLMRLDRTLHFGHDPWRLLQPLAGRPAITKGLDVLYYVWFTVNLVLVAWFGWMEDTRERRRFFLSYLLTWVLLGNVGALVFSSVGPCFYDMVNGDLGPYAELMAYLNGVNAVHPLTALEVQGMLLDAYNAEEVHPIEGIAAMPSLHVAMPFVFAIVATGRRRLLAWCFAAFGVMILLGSIHLGWHYAVDGYAAIAGAFGVCWLVERGLPRLTRLRRA